MDKTTRERLERLANERHALAREMDMVPGAASPRLIEREDGVLCISSRVAASTLLQLCYDDDWVDPRFDWVAWSGSDEFRELVKDNQALQTATPEQLSHLLTILARRDRFIYGAWSADVSSGLLMGIVERAAELSIP